MGLKAAAGQLLLMSIMMGGVVLYTKYHVSSLKRADFTQQEYFEDSKAGDGSRYRVLVRSSDTGGGSFTVEVLTRAGISGFLPDLSGSTPAHNHTQGQEEQLTVISGKLGYIADKGSTTGELGPGQTFTIPAGQVHAIYNADNSSDLLYTLTHRPAGEMGEAFFENLAGFGWDYGSIDRIHPLQALVLYNASGTHLADLNGLITILVDNILLPAADFVGFKADYPSHRSKGAQIVTRSSSSSEGSSRNHEEL